MPLKVSGLAALAACHYLPEMREKIFSVLYKAINSSVKELQVAGKEAMSKVREGRGGEGRGGEGRGGEGRGGEGRGGEGEVGRGGEGRVRAR